MHSAPAFDAVRCLSAAAGALPSPGAAAGCAAAAISARTGFNL